MAKKCCLYLRKIGSGNTSMWRKQCVAIFFQPFSSQIRCQANMIVSQKTDMPLTCS